MFSWFVFVLLVLKAVISESKLCPTDDTLRVVPICTTSRVQSGYVAIETDGLGDVGITNCSCTVSIYTLGYRQPPVLYYYGPDYTNCGIEFDVGGGTFSCYTGSMDLPLMEYDITFRKTTPNSQAHACLRFIADGTRRTEIEIFCRRPEWVPEFPPSIDPDSTPSPALTTTSSNITVTSSSLPGITGGPVSDTSTTSTKSTTPVSLSPSTTSTKSTTPLALSTTTGTSTTRHIPSISTSSSAMTTTTERIHTSRLSSQSSPVTVTATPDNSHTTTERSVTTGVTDTLTIPGGTGQTLTVPSNLNPTTTTASTTTTSTRTTTTPSVRQTSAGIEPSSTSTNIPDGNISTSTSSSSVSEITPDGPTEVTTRSVAAISKDDSDSDSSYIIVVAVCCGVVGILLVTLTVLLLICRYRKRSVKTKIPQPEPLTTQSGYIDAFGADETPKTENPAYLIGLPSIQTFRYLRRSKLSDINYKRMRQSIEDFSRHSSTSDDTGGHAALTKRPNGLPLNGTRRSVASNFNGMGPVVVRMERETLGTETRLVDATKIRDTETTAIMTSTELRSSSNTPRSMLSDSDKGNVETHVTTSLSNIASPPESDIFAVVTKPPGPFATQPRPPKLVSFKGGDEEIITETTDETKPLSQHDVLQKRESLRSLNDNRTVITVNKHKKVDINDKQNGNIKTNGSSDTIDIRNRYGRRKDSDRRATGKHKDVHVYVNDCIDSVYGGQDLNQWILKERRTFTASGHSSGNNVHIADSRHVLGGEGNDNGGPGRKPRSQSEMLGKRESMRLFRNRYQIEGPGKKLKRLEKSHVKIGSHLHSF